MIKKPSFRSSIFLLTVCAGLTMLAPLHSSFSSEGASSKSTEAAEPDLDSEGVQVSHIGAAKLRKEEEEMRQYMIEISRQLNVTCVACHNPKNFKDDTIPAFRTAKEHIKLTRILIDAGMNGLEKNPKADCFMCHRGKLKPDYKEPKDALIPLAPKK